MKKNTIWYVVIGLSLAAFLIYANDGGTTRQKNSGKNFMKTEEPAGTNQKTNQKLPIPPLLEDKNPEEGKAEFNLAVQYGKTEFIEGHETDTLGYNGNYLGPVIKVNQGDEVKINVDNTLDEPTTVHWHGLEVPAEMDGGPRQVVDSHSEWNPHFTIDQPAATLWYHPHLLGKTGEQVYKGLAGLFYIEDEKSKELAIPKEHGVNDIPLVVQDKRFTEGGDIPYELDMRDVMNGFLGDTVLINGAVEPELDIKNEVVRLRVLNGSNARTYDFNFSDQTPFYQIASDGGFLKDSVEMTSLTLAPAERAEILVDFSDYNVGDKVTFNDADNNLMTINITEDSQGKTAIPSDLVDIPKYNKEDISRTREFVMSGMGPMVAINDKQMDENRLDEEVKLNELEEWVITNESSGGMGMMSGTAHPFHVHGTQFKIIERNGKEPPLNEQGWKDTVLVETGAEVKVLAVFKKEGLFMYHCHIL
ncbi:MAG: multicopper oxidase domain-containing protein, partial [Pisciglobus halotolerans]|nr:multicopper oxidase domain-containing protein [Pisciglobus halotolerans]